MRSPGGCPLPCSAIFNSRGNWADCIATSRIALESARQVGNRQGEAWILNTLGDALGQTRQSEGIDCLERSLAIRREIGDRMGEAQAANNLADAYQRLGRTDEALDLYRRALELNRAVGYRLGEGIALGSLGWTLLDLARAGEAIDYLRQAQDAFDEIDYADGMGYALHILGRCYLSLGRDAEALDCLQRGAGQPPGHGQPAHAGSDAEIHRHRAEPGGPDGRGARVVDSGGGHLRGAWRQRRGGRGPGRAGRIRHLLRFR